MNVNQNFGKIKNFVYFVTFCEFFFHLIGFYGAYTTGHVLIIIWLVYRKRKIMFRINSSVIF